MSASRAKCVRRSTLGALVLLAVVACGRAPTVASREPITRDPDAPITCIQAWPEARYRNYGYDHLVHLYNACTVAAACDVSTNVAPKVIHVHIVPGEKREVLTFRGSPSSEFQMRVYCRLIE